MRIGMQPIRPRKNLLDYRVYEAALKEAFRDEIMPELVDRFEAVVSDWEHKPDFQARMKVDAHQIEVTVKPTGDNAKIWRYVDEGTRPHVIRPRRAKALSFRTGYSARTRAPARAHAGTGRATGEQVSARLVQHPGTEARGFTGDIVAQFQPWFKDALQEAIREAAS